MPHQATQAFFDWVDTLPEKEKIYALDMHEYISTKNIKPRMYNKENFQYWFKGNRIMYLRKNSCRHTPLDIAIPYGLKGRYGDIDSFIAMCSDENNKSELITYIINNICCCDRCGNRPNNCGGQWREFAGVRRKISGCHHEITKWKAPKAKLNYENDDLYWLKRLVDVKIRQILHSS
jgi:hypothetical protein